VSRAYLTHCRAMQSHAKGPPISPDMRLMETCVQIKHHVDGVGRPNFDFQLEFESSLCLIRAAAMSRLGYVTVDAL